MARITLSDIAEKANVSLSTVSRVLNGYPHVDNNTREIVLKIAYDLGYPLKKLQENTDALRTILLTGMGAPDVPEHNARNSLEFSSLILSGSESVLQEQGITVRMQTQLLPETFDTVETYAGSNPGLEGLILMGGRIDYEFIDKLQMIGLPFVIVGGHPRSLNVNCVIVDYKHGLEKAVDLLAKQDRRKICLLNGLPYTITSLEKYKGFRLALALQDYTFESDQVVEAAFSAEDGQAATNCLLDKHPDLDAIICGDDYQALGAIRVLQDSGRRVPDDVAVIGHHNFEIATLTQPPLTTIDLNTRQMGVLAAHRLLHMINDQDSDVWSILNPVTLIEREST